MLNLLNYDIYTSPVFKNLPPFETIEFKGFIKDKVEMFKASDKGEVVNIFVSNIIRQEDKFIAESCADLLAESVKQATDMTRGVCRFDVFCFDVQNEIRSFNPLELAKLLSNHCRSMKAGEMRPVKYSSVYGMLTKMLDEDWGKIIFQPSVEVFLKEPEQLDLHVKYLLRAAEGFKERKIFVVNDLSLTPLYDSANQEQLNRMKKVTASLNSLFSLPTQILYQSKDRHIDISSS